MRGRLVLAGIASLAAIGAGFAVAQEDPIGQLTQKAPEQEAVTPPAPAEAAKTAPAAPVAEVKEEAKVAAVPAEKKAATVTQTRRPRYPVAIIQAMDKITAESIRFEARVDKPVSYKNLVFTVRACETTAGDEPVRDAIANVEVSFRPPSARGGKRAALRQVYRGWMFAASPSISPVEHPVYDAWLIACKADGPVSAPVLIQAPISAPEITPKVMPKLGPSAAAPKAKVEIAPPSDSLAPPTIAPPPEPRAAPPPPTPKADDRVILY